MEEKRWTSAEIRKISEKRKKNMTEKIERTRRAQSKSKASAMPIPT
jgi:hypothetical protein